jgi:hypothetical protein
MLWLRFASLLILAIWIGGLAVLGALGAPAIFTVLEAVDPAAGADLAGRVFGAVLASFLTFGAALGVLMLMLLATRAALGPRPRRWGLRMWTVMLMLACGAVTTYWISPRIDAIREGVPGSIAALADDDPRRVEFGRLHGLSTLLMAATVLAGGWLMWAELRDEH